MTTKTTMLLESSLLRAARKAARKKDISVSELLARGLRVYMSDPEAIEETTAVLTDGKASSALLEAREARAQYRKGYYTPWRKARGV